MSYTNAQLVRREVGDRGVYTRKSFSGDGTTKVFYLPGPLLSGALVYLSGVLKAEGTDYTLDVETGRLAFVAAPGAGTDNGVVEYYAVELSEGDITEALRQRSLTSTDTADTGYAAGMLLAASDLADWLASKFAYGYDSQIDGQSLSRSQRATAWEKIAEKLREKARRYGGLVSTTIVKIDGYNYAEANMRDINNTTRNPRQRYYYVDNVDAYP